MLTVTRYTVAWRALGVALAAYEHALAYAKQREQFGHPLASYQLVQDKLAGWWPRSRRCSSCACG